MGLQVTERHCEHVPERVINVNSTTIVWHVPVIAVRTVCNAAWYKGEDVPTDRCSYTKCSAAWYKGEDVPTDRCSYTK